MGSHHFIVPNYSHIQLALRALSHKQPELLSSKDTIGVNRLPLLPCDSTLANQPGPKSSPRGQEAVGREAA